MASSRKKSDEKNLKTLRELAALTQNKFCFDCNQRGPTYVNVTIGSFVCTKCSGMLRGLTPPHRVKSISMATFTTEEIDLLRNRGNDYCRRVWLGLHEGSSLLSQTGDEISIRNFMVDKYERKRYYLDPGMTKLEVPNTRPVTHIVSDPKLLKVNGTRNGLNGTNSNVSNGSHFSTRNGVNGTTNGAMQNSHRSRPEVKNYNANNFVADFDKADIFSSTQGNNNVQSTTTQNGFANFDNNPVFSSNGSTTITNGTTGMPTASTLSNWTNQHNKINNTLNNTPAQDKYAALKDLDNEMKSQSTLDWSSSGSNGSLYSSPTPTGSMYSSPSPQGSIFGSPSQGQLMNNFCSSQENGTGAPVINPFNGGNNGINWGNQNGFTNGMNGTMNGAIHPQNQQQQPVVNPFKEQQSKMNGFSTNVFQPMFPSNNALPVNGITNGWPANPFKVTTATNMNSNNPFL